MKNKVAISLMVLIIICGAIIASVAAINNSNGDGVLVGSKIEFEEIHRSIRVVPNTTIFGKIEMKPWREITAQDVLDELGGTMLGESSLKEVHQMQGKEYFSLEYEGIEFHFFNDYEIKGISISSEDFLGPRKTTVGMKVTDILRAFPIINKTIIKLMNIEKENPFDNVYFSNSDSVILYSMGKSGIAPFYEASIALDQDNTMNNCVIQYKDVYETGSKESNPEIGYEVFSLVNYEIADGIVTKIDMTIVDVE